MLPIWDMPPDPDKMSGDALFETSAFKMRSRFSKTLYCGEVDEDDITDDDYDDDEDITPPLPLTDIAVEYFQEVAPRKFGCVDRILASSVASRARASPCSVMMSMIYAKRLRHKNPAYLDHMSSSDLFLISMMIASKFIYDDGIEEEVFNDEWAEAADLELSEINTLEQQFLKAIDWQLFVKREEFFHLVNKLEQRIALQQAIDRGWFSYTDLSVLMRNPDFDLLWTKIGTCWLQVVLISSTAYLAGVMVVVASTITALQVSSTLTIVGTVLLSQSSVTQLHPVTPLPTVTGPVLPKPFVSVTTPNEEVAPNISRFDQLVQETHDDSASKPTNENTLLENLLQKLFAVMTLKENLVKFVCAVSDHYLSPTHEELSNNQSSPSGKTSCGLGEHAAGLSSHQMCSKCQLKQSTERSRKMPDLRYLTSSSLPLRANSAHNSAHGNGIQSLNGHFSSCNFPDPTKSGHAHSDQGTSDTHCRHENSAHNSDFDVSDSANSASVLSLPMAGPHKSCCCEEPPGFIPRLVDASLSFTTRSSLPISVGA